MNPMNRNVPVNPEQIQNALRLLEAKIAMREAKRVAMKELGHATRQLMREFVRSQTNTCNLQLEWWIDAHEKQEGWNISILDVELSELKSQLEIGKAALSEAKEAPSGLIT
jgi:hypothetical protein